MSAPKRKICIIATTPLVFHFFFRPLLRRLVESFDVTIAYNKNLDTYLGEIDLPLNLVHIPIRRKISPLFDVIALIGLIKTIKRGRFDIVVTVVPKAGLLGMAAAFFCGVSKRVHIFQGEVWATTRGMVFRLLKSLDTLTARMATHALAVSKSERQFLESHGVVQEGRIKVLGDGSICGVDTSRFKPNAENRAAVRSELGIPCDATVCIYLGRITRDKGVIDLTRAFAFSAAVRPSLWLIVAGPDEDGMQEELLEVYPPQVRDRIVVQDFVRNPEQLLAAADFLCLPSYREGFGIVILEAAALGIPSIGSRIYGITDAIEENQTGAFFPAGDVQALSSAINRWTDNPDERRQVGNQARSRVKSEFEQRDVVQLYADYLTHL